MTIKDIARESGYAVGTVSRALNNAPGVSAETRQKILEIVNRHNYEPNANAKHLKQQTNDGIALIVKGTQNMLFAGILEPLQQIIEESGYVATVYYIDEEANEVAQARRICTERKPHGILFLGSNPEYFTPELEALGIPCLLLTNSAASLRIRNLSSVSVDDMAASDKGVAIAVTDYSESDKTITFAASITQEDNAWVETSKVTKALDDDVQIVYIDADDNKAGDSGVGITEFDGTTGYANALVVYDGNNDHNKIVAVIVNTNSDVNVLGGTTHLGE